MSNSTDNNEIIATDESTEELTADLRGPSNPFLAKPPLHVDDKSKPLTAADIVKLTETIRQEMNAKIKEASFDSRKDAQVIRKAVVPITDFSKVTLDDVYDLSFPIEAKPFMSADVLFIQLQDSNYEARWVNVNPQNIGDKLAKGFTYVEPKDLLQGTQDAIQTSLDASGHYKFNDVVAMKIDKATYYKALRAAHERAVNTTNQAKARKRAAETANGYMEKSDFSNDFGTARNAGKMEFYDPGVTV